MKLLIIIIFVIVIFLLLFKKRNTIQKDERKYLSKNIENKKKENL